MAIRAALELGNPLLRQPAQPVRDVQDVDTQQIIADLWDTLDDLRQQYPWVRALAGPVIGYAARIVVIDYKDRRLLLINPRFESWSRAQMVAYESCVTFRMIWGEVSRPARIAVVALDAAGHEQRYDVDGVLARIIQHELDHLDGLVWLDRDPDLQTICTTNEYMRVTMTNRE